MEFDADAFIVDEDANVVITRDGWLKRVRELKDPTATRLREGDEVMAVLAGSTREKVAFFTNYGSAYVIKINDIAASAGYGDPAQKYFKFKDGERIVSAFTFDPRVHHPTQKEPGVPDTMLAVSARGYGLRFAVAPYLEVTTRAGRRFAKPAEGDEMVGVVASGDKDIVVVATRTGHVLVCKSEDINKLENPGRGVTVIKTGDDDAVIGFISGATKGEQLVIESEGGKRFEVGADKGKVVARGGKGNQVIKRTTLRLVRPPVVVTPLANAAGSEGVH